MSHLRTIKVQEDWPYGHVIYMATAQLRRNQTKSETWSSIFSSSEQLNEQQSALFVKKLLAVAISSVTYLRAVFPERCFGDRCLEDLNLKILRDEDAYPGSNQVIHWVKGCFDAIDRKYLRKLILGFYINPSDPDTVIETYTFKFDYYKDGINIYRNGQEIASAQTAGETKRATIRLLRTLVLLTQTLKSLPDDVMMTMKILYYDDVTPGDYQPPGFKDTDYVGPKFTDEPFKVSVGDISTPFHMVGLRVQSELHQLESAGENMDMKEDEHELKKDTEAETSESYLDHENDFNSQQKEKDAGRETTKNPYEFHEEEPVSTKIRDMRTQGKVKDDNATKLSTEDDHEKMECGAVPVQTPNIPGQNDVASGVNTRFSTPATPEDEQEVPRTDEIKVLCSCGYNGDDGLMILCGICETWQHAACYRCLTEDDCPVLHICVSCAAKDESKICTDGSLPRLDPINLQSTCLWRRALVACKKNARLTAPAFSKRLGVELTVAQGLMKRMHKEGFLRMAAKGKRLGKLVNKEKFTTVELRKYLNEDETENEKTASVERGPIKNTEHNEKNKKDDQEKDLQSMVNKAAQIDISGRHRTRSETWKASQGEVKNGVQPNGKGHGRKRVISSIDKEMEFSISDSQDTMDWSQALNPPKKRKASIAEKAILI